MKTVCMLPLAVAMLLGCAERRTAPPPTPPPVSAGPSPSVASAVTTHVVAKVEPVYDPGAKARSADARRSCVDQAKLSACLPLLPPTASATSDAEWAPFAECFVGCIRDHEETNKTALKEETEACVGRYMQSARPTAITCSFPQAGALFDRKVAAEELKRAAQNRDGAALDAFQRKSDADYFARVQPDCTKQCRSEGSERVEVATKGSELVTSYKRCMVAADSTHEARKLAVYETDLYCGLILKANERCRAANKCDLVEAHSALQCTYASPGVGRCQP